jgi:hypothetical protein
MFSPSIVVLDSGLSSAWGGGGAVVDGSSGSSFVFMQTCAVLINLECLLEWKDNKMGG